IYTAVRQKPLLLIHLIQEKDSGSSISVAPSGCETLVGIGLSFPELDVASHRISYRINLVELRNILSGDTSNIQPDDEDEEDDE
ncbi:hypothetical protein, partial [Pseudomonas viridiflava]|uniref:hypothetical protein n=1 Tax=Pseudomonas viridiflava TaxID=33069 RepID=UPI0013CF048E